MRKKLLLGWALLLAACASSDGDGSGDGRCTSNAECGDGICVDMRCEAAAPDAGRAEDGGQALRDANVDAAPRTDTGPPCEATETPETTCNGIDDDCNGIVDDVDVGADGICDCLRIGVIGDPGTRASSNFQTWLEERGTSVTRINPTDPLTVSDLEPFDIVILDRLQRDFSAEEATVLASWVAGGGGVMSMTGYTGSGEDRTRPNTLMAGLGLEYLEGLHNGPATDWRDHAIATDVSSVTFAGGYLVSETPAAASAANTVVAGLAGGAAGIAQEREMGRAFVWGDEWIQFDSEWSTMPMIEKLWANILGWLGPRDSCLPLF